MPEQQAPAHSPSLLLLFDGECGLCSRLVQWIFRHDRRAAFSFAPLQGATAAPLLLRHGIARTSDNEPGTAVLIVRNREGRERAFVRSRAVIESIARLGGVYRLIRLAWLMPRPLRDAVYRWIAQRRYQLFGRANACAIMDARQSGRMLP